MPPIDATGNNLVVGLKEDGSICEVVEERYDGGLDIEGVEPESKDAGFTLAFGVKVIDLRFFFFGNRVKAWVCVEEVGYEGEVKFGVSSDQGRGGEEFATFELIRVVEDLLCSLEKVACLKGRAAADIWFQLIEEDGVVLAIFDVVGEILDSASLSA